MRPPVVDALTSLGVAYRVGGSVASSALGVPRSTLDADIVCDITEPPSASHNASVEGRSVGPVRRA
jgi:hypothetical protein